MRGKAVTYSVSHLRVSCVYKIKAWARHSPREQSPDGVCILWSNPKLFWEHQPQFLAMIWESISHSLKLWKQSFGTEEMMVHRREDCRVSQLRWQCQLDVAKSELCPCGTCAWSLGRTWKVQRVDYPIK